MKKEGIFICLFLLFVVLISSLPLVLSYNGFGWSWYSPQDLLNNEWVMFALIFIVFFAIIFFSLGKVMKENKGAAAVISVAISLFIAVSISRRVWFYGYFGEELSSWFVVFAVIIGIVFLINIITKLLGGIGLFLVLGGLWFLFSQTNFSDILPSSVTDSEIFEFLIGGWGIGILIVVLIILLIIAYSGEGNETIKDWLRPRKKPETYLDWLAKKRR